MAFNKGFTANRWNRARELREFYETEIGDKSKSLREFYKKDNVALNNVYKYEITIELDYVNSEKGYEFFIPQETFIFYSTNPDNKNFYEEQVKGAISNVFKGGARNWVYDNVQFLSTDIVRGIEQSDNKVDYNEFDTNKLIANNGYIKDNGSISVNKKPKKGSVNTNNYNLNIYDN